MKPCCKKIGAISIGVIAIILIPFLINRLVASNSPTWLSPVAGASETEAAWIGFWANYLGSVLATCVSFIVLYKTLKQNETENMRNRKDAHKENMSNSRQQVKQLSYEIAKQHLSDVRNTLVECFMAMEQEKTNDLFWRLKRNETGGIDLNVQRDTISMVVDDANRAFYKLELLFPKSTRNDDETRIMRNIRRYSHESHNCLSDLVWLAQFYLDPSVDLKNQVEISDRVRDHFVRQHKSRLAQEGYYTIDKCILDNKWFDFEINRDSILNAWQFGKDKANSFLLDSLNELNEYQTQIVERILES